MKPIQAGSKHIGPGYPCFIAAEIGINHNGDMALAKRMIDAAVDAGADAVKFQNYRTDNFLSDRTLIYTYQSQGRTVTETQYDMFRRCELSVVQLQELRIHCDAKRVVFFSTPTGDDGIRDLLDAGAPLLKNGSDYLTNLPLIRSMARSGLPTILSTGMAIEEEIADAVNAFEDAGGKELVLLHCTSAYPTPDEEVNLRKIDTLRQRFGHLVGFSDHSWGNMAALGAVALGACFVEKHFTLDKNLPGPDHAFSSDPTEFSELTAGIRRLEKSLGQSVIGPTDSEMRNRTNFRLSCVAIANLPAGHVVGMEDIVFRRPGNGLPPKMAESLVGMVLTQPLERGACFPSSDSA
ncbi:N-acetylneuraminate synthase [Herbaspirillum lusitanum]|uniref:N-acetylneuraminate synthase family protein n=1 Tax=Herbaspirillum lusitanum TaxID=213312 RepID=UPI002237BDE7|nr:N-acetylneuraminate synthase family protein [Herbaspirillum lusitanum]MCW5300590.1 N-acetylneuraminate synthase [Herbaspirillum lusitanum]